MTRLTRALAAMLCLTGHVGSAHRTTLGIDPAEHRDHDCLFTPDLDEQTTALAATPIGAALDALVEAAVRNDGFGYGGWCWECGYDRRDKHRDDCRVAAFLAITEEDPDA